MKPLYVVFTLLAVSVAQKPRAKHPKAPPHYASSPGGGGGGPSGGDHHSYYAPQYESYPQHSPKSSAVSGASKATYPVLLSDTRNFNEDGTINFNFQADNGLQQGETVDPDGTRRGFYSYPGADGKLITVKYTAGKHGFVAEGDHLPLQPQAALHSDTDDGQYDEELYNKPSKSRKSQKPQAQHRPPTPSYNHYSGPPTPVHSPAPAPAPYRPQPQPQIYRSPAPAPVHRQRQRPYSPYDGPSSYPSSPYSSPEREFDDDIPDFAPAGFGSPQSFSNYAGAGAPVSRPVRYPGPSAAPVSNYLSAAPARPSGRRPGPGFTADNPYQPHGSGPYAGRFDLGNNGHFSINFTPGASQEYQPEGPSYSPSSAIYTGIRPSYYRANSPIVLGVRGGTRGQY